MGGEGAGEPVATRAAVWELYVELQAAVMTLTAELRAVREAVEEIDSERGGPGTIRGVPLSRWIGARSRFLRDELLTGIEDDAPGFAARLAEVLERARREGRDS